jgi:pimeloyl-ACP methyl ester carboxylesterase
VSGETRYAASGEVSIAYQVMGAGPLDVLVVPGIVSHVEAFHELPGYTRLLELLARGGRVITFDKRGNGLSDRVAEAPSLFERIDDVRAVLDAAGSRRTVLLGISEGAAMSILFAAQHPERTHALVLFGAFARMLAAPGYGAGFSPEAYAAFTARMVEGWGTGATLTTLFGPSLAADDAARSIAARCERASATPTTLRQLWRMNASIDVRDVLPSLTVPTLLLHRADDRVVPVAASHAIAAAVPDARLLELPGQDHFPFVGDLATVAHEVSTWLGASDPTVLAPAAALREADLEASVLDALIARATFEGPMELGRFVAERPLGAGGMGTVYLARDRDLDRPVALKVLHTRDVAAFRRFRREATAVARLSHPNVVAIHELGLDAEVPYLVMEYVAGGTLADCVAPVAWERAARLVLAAARGVGAAHAVGIVHRDVKPANLLLVARDGDEVKVADFGVAKLAGSEPITGAGAVVGTVGYLAPEQARGDAVDARSDVYALGIVLYRLLTGRLPFEGTMTEVIVATMTRAIPPPDAPAALAALVQRMAALAPDDRPGDANAAAAELAALISR